MTLYKFNQDTQIDEFGVDHSNFSLRDEVEYNIMRANESNAAKLTDFATTQTNSGFSIRDDGNYAWDVPQEYDRRPNMAGTFNNFMKINRENPIQKPFTTGNIVGDFQFMRALGNISPFAKAAVWGANAGSLIGGYAGNLKRAYDESHLFDKNNETGSFILQDK